ncbi:FMN reductase [Pseudomonas sp. PA1(2017)]|uniref:FMN reductase n=1 Tax=Pseudomonas sp. PA1(2017) TaxID=1932113 RepID=UPI0009613773|nr:FMN reductase [Pseudomonas sp. PA1(2017)]OLU17167.1 FMN reductase [Pseudomonas sp. PA1(2017)]
MSTPFKIVAVSGGTSRPSRTLALTEAIVCEIGKHLAIDTHLIELGNIARPLGGALWRKELSVTVEHELRQIESADLLVVAAPVYRGTYPGLFKHLFDLIDQSALIDTPVLLAATGGSERHALVLDHQLRPLFSFFQSLTLPIGVYASEADFADYRVASDALQARIELAAERTAALVRGQTPALSKIA